MRPERDLPYVFVGRQHELSRLDNHFNVISARKQGSSGLVLVYGIPGIGKTQLIEKFARDKEHSGEGHRGQSATLRNLPTGRSGLPIMIICAGLQNAPDVLQSHGLSRLGERIELDLLNLQDSEAAIRQMLEVWECPVAQSNRKIELQVRALANSTQGFPCHLQSHLTALKAVIRDKCEQFGEKEDWVRVDEIAKQKRDEYYSGRIEALGFPNAGIVMHRIAKLLRDRKHSQSNTVSSADIIKILNAVEKDGLVEIEKGVAFNRMIKSGNLKVEDYSFYTIPIPSFQEHLVAIADPYVESSD